MTINCIDERLKIIKKLWNREHDPHTIEILLYQLQNDIVYFCNEKLPDTIKQEIENLWDEVDKYE